MGGDRARRHLTASQRAQMVVEAFDWVPKGANQHAPIGASKTKEDLAKEANVGKGTIDRAKQVSCLGRSKEVISGEKWMCHVAHP